VFSTAFRAKQWHHLNNRLRHFAAKSGGGLLLTTSIAASSRLTAKSLTNVSLFPGFCCVLDFDPDAKNAESKSSLLIASLSNRSIDSFEPGLFPPSTSNLGWALMNGPNRLTKLAWNKSCFKHLHKVQGEHPHQLVAVLTDARCASDYITNRKTHGELHVVILLLSGEAEELERLLETAKNLKVCIQSLQLCNRLQLHAYFGVILGRHVWAFLSRTSHS
jgi:hypothetical protein